MTDTQCSQLRTSSSWALSDEDEQVIQQLYCTIYALISNHEHNTINSCCMIKFLDYGQKDMVQKHKGIGMAKKSETRIFQATLISIDAMTSMLF